MPATVETTTQAPDASPDSGAFASSPLLLLVFGFVLLVLLQAWFVRRITQLTARHKERQSTHRKLGTEAAELADEVAGLSRAGESGATSIAGLGREIEELQKRIDAFVADHETAAPKTAAPATATGTAPSTSTAADDDTEAGQSA